MAQYLNINVRVPLPDDALKSAQIQTTALTCTQSFRDDISAKLKGFSVIEMTAGVVRVKGPKKEGNTGNAQPAAAEPPVPPFSVERLRAEDAQNVVVTATSASKPVEREITEPAQQRAPTPPWAQQ